MNIFNKSHGPIDQTEISILKDKLIKWRSPSNIALTKYWGKYENQIPANPSISFTLSKSYTESSIEIVDTHLEVKDLEVEYFFNNKRDKFFEEKVILFFTKVIQFFPFLKHTKLRISSYNTFPHSAGIASSASSMSALALCLCSIEKLISSQKIKDNDFYKRASFISRIGSGSACRSIFGGVVQWGFDKEQVDEFNLYARPIEGVPGNFLNYQDAIIIVDSSKKEISSSEGHKLMMENPFCEARFIQGKNNTVKLKKALFTNNTNEFNRIIKSEALTLHGLMMSSNPPYTLMKPNTLEILKVLEDPNWAFRDKVTYTLDAGPNIHLLYPKELHNAVSSYIEDNVRKFCEKIIYDEVGAGPIEIKE